MQFKLVRKLILIETKVHSVRGPTIKGRTRLYTQVRTTLTNQNKVFFFLINIIKTFLCLRNEYKSLTFAYVNIDRVGFRVGRRARVIPEGRRRCASDKQPTLYGVVGLNDFGGHRDRTGIVFLTVWHDVYGRSVVDPYYVPR